MRYPNQEELRFIVNAALASHIDPIKIADQIIEHLNRHIESDVPKHDLEENIVKFVCYRYKTTMERMSAKSRKREDVEGRQVAQYLLATYTQMSLKAIGQKFGGRDHSTVIHSRDTVRDIAATNRAYREKLQESIIFVEQLVYKNEQETPPDDD